METTKIFAELVDKKLARHYELDDSETKKVTSLLRNKTTTGSLFELLDFLTKNRLLDSST